MNTPTFSRFLNLKFSSAIALGAALILGVGCDESDADSPSLETFYEDCQAHVDAYNDCFDAMGMSADGYHYQMPCDTADSTPELHEGFICITELLNDTDCSNVDGMELMNSISECF